MKLYYYKATKRIDKTALIEFLKKTAIKNKDITLKVCDVAGVVYFWTSEHESLEKIDELYPNIFKPSGPPPLEGIVLFTNL